MITKINKASLIIVTRHSCCVRPPHEVIMIRLRHAQLGNFAYVNYQVADMKQPFSSHLMVGLNKYQDILRQKICEDMQVEKRRPIKFH